LRLATGLLSLLAGGATTARVGLRNANSGEVFTFGFNDFVRNTCASGVDRDTPSLFTYAAYLHQLVRRYQVIISEDLRQ